MRRALRLACLSFIAAASGGLLGGSVAPAAPRQSQVRLGSSPLALRGASVIGGLAADVPVRLTVVLKERDPAGAAALASQVATPGSPFYRDYLTPSEFGRRFGATPGQLRAVVASLEAHGLRPGRIPPDRLLVPVTASAGQLEHALSIRFERVRLADGRVAVTPSAAPALDRSISGYVQSVVGLSSIAAPRPLLVRPALRRGRLRAGAARQSPRVQTGGPQPCAAASSAASQQGAYTADQIASAYGFPGLYRGGDQGQGVTVAVYELEPNDPADIAAYQACYGTHASVSYVPVDGGPGSSGPGSGEAALDIENLVGLAPRATYLVYQAPNATQSVPGSGPYDDFYAIVNQDRAQVVSVSWGECEQLEGSSGAAAESTLFEQAAIQGQSIVSAAGDEGSEDCNGANNSLPDTQLAVDDPGSQPFVTGVGGTTMSSLGPPPAQAVWNNGGNLTAVSGVQGGAGGGGVSGLWAMPGYQSLAAGSLHVVNGYSSASSCGATSGYCREVPDVSADADPATGYVIYYNGSSSDPTQPSGWQAVGGTSAAAPVWAATVAVIDASAACSGSPVGFANPALYRAAASVYGRGLDDVTTGNNDFTGTNGGRYPAGAGYDMASGLGTPNAAGLASALCADTLRIRYPGAQTSALGQRVALQVHTSGPVSGSVSYLAAGLPSGVSISKATGLIAGRPNKVGRFVAEVVAVDQAMAIRGTAFVWNVAAAPHVGRVSLSGVAASRPKLRFTVSAGAGGPAIKQVTIAVPSGLGFRRASAITISGAGGRQIRFHAHAGGRKLTLTLRSASSRFTVTVSYPALRAGGALGSRVRRGGTRVLRIEIITTDSARHRVALSVRVRPRR